MMIDSSALSSAISIASMEKLAGMQKLGLSRTMKYLKQLLSRKQIGKLDATAEAMKSKGVLPKGKYIGEAPFRGEENVVHLWTGGIPAESSASTFSKRGVDPALLVEKSPIIGGMYTSPEKHKATMHMYKNVANSDSLAESFLPFSVRRTPNKLEAATAPEFSERIFQPFVRDASAFSRESGAAKAAPLFRRGRLDVLDEPAANPSVLDAAIRKTPVDRGTLDITDLKPDNFVRYNGKVQLADATPSAWIYDSPIKSRLAEALPFSTRSGVLGGTLVNPGLFVQGTPADSIAKKALSTLAIPALRDLISNPGAAYRMAKNTPVPISDLLGAATTNTRILQNISYAANESGATAQDVLKLLSQLAQEASKGGAPTHVVKALPRIMQGLNPQEAVLLKDYLHRRVPHNALSELLK